MPGVVNQGALNPSSVVAPGVYVQVLPPPTYIVGVPTNVYGCVGTASWGPVNTPVLIGNPSLGVTAFGPIVGPTPAAGQISAINNPYDLQTEIFAAFQQATSGAGLQAWAVRVLDGLNYTQGGTPGVGGPSANTTGAYASYTLHDSSAVLGITLYGYYMGSVGNGLAVTTAVGSKGAGYVTVTITPPAGLGLVPEVYPNIVGSAGTSGTTLSTFWANFAAVLINGIQGVRGPSQLVVGILNSALATAKPATPAIVAAAAFTGGIDGNSLATGVATNVLGSSTSTPQTGLFALRAKNPPVAVFSLAGFGELSSDFSNLATVQTFADSEGALFVCGFPAGDSTTTALGLVATDDYEVAYVKDRAYFNDGVSGPRFHSMAPFYAGLIATLPPWVSPLNQQIKGIIGTERDIINAAQASAGVLPIAAPYSLAEIGQVQAGRVSLVARPSPGGNYEGLNVAVNSSSNPAASPIEYSTMTNFLSKSFATSLGKYIGQNQSTRPDDQVRQNVRKDFNTFLQNLANNLAIDSFSVQCDLTNNTSASIAAHYLYCNVLVKYLSSVWYFLVSFTGGTTVAVTVQSS